MSETVAEGLIASGTLQQFVDTLTPLVSEANVHFTDDGLTVHVVDPANAASYVPVELSDSAFESYDAPGEVRIGVPLTTLDERLGPANSDDLVNIAVDMETRKLELRYRNIEQAVMLIDPDAVRQEPDMPDIDLPNMVTIEGRQFAEAVTVADLVSDHVTIEGVPEDKEFRFVAEGDTDDSVVTFGREETIAADVVEPAETILSLPYLEEFTKPMPDSAEVEIQFGDEYPIIFEYETCDGNLSVVGLLAPRIGT